MRTVLAMIAALLTAAGPGVCCCLPKLFAVKAPPTIAKAEPVKNACPFCKPAETQSPTESPKAPKSCGCAERLLVAPVATPDVPVQPDATFDVESTLDTLTAPASADPSTVAGPQTDIPFLPPKDRLRVHHALRL